MKALQKIWYDKLKEAGFQDIENTETPQRYLKQWHSRYFFIRNTPEEYQETQEYIDMALHFYWHYTAFKNDRDKQIWWLHCQGRSRREIGKEPDIMLSDSMIQIILAGLKKIMQSCLWPSSEGAYHFRDDCQEEFDQH